MKKELGFIKIYRSLIENEILLDPKRFTILMFLALKATHRPVMTNIHGTAHLLQDGECVCSREIICENLHMTDGVVRRALSSLKKRKMINIKVIGGVSVIKITIPSICVSGYAPEDMGTKKIENDPDISNELFQKENKDLDVKVNSSNCDVSDPMVPFYKNIQEVVILKATNIDVPPTEPIDPPVLTKPKSDLHRLGSYFCDKFKEKFGARYIFQYGRDNASLKRLLNGTGEAEKVAELIDLFFEDNDPFLMKTGYSISMLEKKANAYIVERSTRNSY